jgi:hypothetical protein
LLAALALLAYGPTSRADIRIPRIGGIGINFVGGGPPGGPSYMLTPEINKDGSVSYWNNATGASGIMNGLVNGVDAITTADLTYSAANIGSTGIPTTTQYDRVMEGYLDSGGLGSHTLITVTGVPYAKYDVYVFTDGYNPETREGLYTLGGVTHATTDPANVDFSGTFIYGQNYTAFFNLTASSFTLDATPADVGADPRAPVNGILIGNTPEPSTWILAVTGAVGLAGSVWGRRRAGKGPQA